MRSAVRIAVAVMVVCLVSAVHVSAQAFLFTNFDPPDSTFTELWGINNGQMLVGNCFQCNAGADGSWIFDGQNFTFYQTRSVRLS